MFITVTSGGSGLSIAIKIDDISAVHELASTCQVVYGVDDSSNVKENFNEIMSLISEASGELK